MLKLCAATAALGALLVCGPIAGGAANTIADGETVLALDGALYKELKDEGVQVLRLKPGTVQGKRATLPIAAGQVDFAARGSMKHKGGIAFRAGKRVVALRKIFLNTGKEVMSATVGKRSLKISSAQPHSAKWNGFDLDAGVRALPLTGKAARLLNAKLGLDRVFKSGHSLGRISSVIQLEWLTVFGGNVTLAFDPSFDTKLKSLEVTATPFESTKVLSPLPPSFSMDVPNGQITPDLAYGVLVTEGGFRLKQGEGPEAVEAAVTGISVALDSKRLAGSMRIQPSGVSAASQLGFLDLNGSTTNADPKTGTITASGIKATLEPTAADALNEAFAKPKGKSPLFVAGEPLGTVGFTARTR